MRRVWGFDGPFQVLIRHAGKIEDARNGTFPVGFQSHCSYTFSCFQSDLAFYSLCSFVREVSQGMARDFSAAPDG
jgi:hypothetical protein